MGVWETSKFLREAWAVVAHLFVRACALPARECSRRLLVPFGGVFTIYNLQFTV